MIKIRLQIVALIAAYAAACAAILYALNHGGIRALFALVTMVSGGFLGWMLYLLYVQSKLTFSHIVVLWLIVNGTCHSRSSVKKYFIVIRGALNDAIRDGAISINPEALVEIPKETKEEVSSVLTQEEASELLRVAQEYGEPLGTAVMLGLCYGLRRSEVCGLRWMDINFGKKKMYIRHTVVQNGTVLLDEEHTKSKSSKRTIDLIDFTIPYLKSVMAKQVESGRVMDKVVCWPDGRPVRPDGILRAFQTLLRNNGMRKIRFHDLRHTAATLLANNGMPPKSLQAFLGHSSIEETLNVYTHITEDTHNDASERMGSIFSEGEKSEICSGFCSGLSYLPEKRKNM